MTESPLPAFFESGLVADAELAVVLEPTDCILHAGCLGNIQARVAFHGESAHSARPWTGVNAIHELVGGLQSLAALEPLDVELDGLTYREVVSVVRVEGGIADNVIPAAGERRPQLPLRARTRPRRGRAAAALARSKRRARGSEQLALGPTRVDEPTRRAAARARAGRRAEAGVDAGGPVRRAGHRRRQLRARPRPATHTGKMSRCPSRTSTSRSRRCKPSLADQPDARRDGVLSLREARGDASCPRRPRRRRPRLRQGRPERADRPEDPSGTRRRAARARAVPARRRAARAARVGRPLVQRAGSGSSSIPAAS